MNRCGIGRTPRGLFRADMSGGKRAKEIEFSLSSKKVDRIVKIVENT
jgi:hypothetical protein